MMHISGMSFFCFLPLSSEYTSSSKGVAIVEGPKLEEIT